MGLGEGITQVVKESVDLVERVGCAAWNVFVESVPSISGYIDAVKDGFDKKPHVLD